MDVDFMGKNLHPFYESHLELLANKVNKLINRKKYTSMTVDVSK